MFIMSSLSDTSIKMPPQSQSQATGDSDSSDGTLSVDINDVYATTSKRDAAESNVSFLCEYGVVEDHGSDFLFSPPRLRPLR